MSNDNPTGGSPAAPPQNERRFMGSLRDALVAAGRSDSAPTSWPPAALPVASAQPGTPGAPPPLPAPDAPRELPGAAAAVREAKGGAAPREVAAGDDVPRSRVLRGPRAAAGGDDAPRTKLLRGKSSVKRADFFQDPVVGWLVVVGGLGLGAHRAIYEGNNTIGRAATQRIPIDFGDETISSEEQAYIRYDSTDRKFLLVPNLAKTNVVSVNDKKPTGAVELQAMDLITMGRTQLVFVPFCGQDFDWAEISESKD